MPTDFERFGGRDYNPGMTTEGWDAQDYQEMRPIYGGPKYKLRAYSDVENYDVLQRELDRLMEKKNYIATDQGKDPSAFRDTLNRLKDEFQIDYNPVAKRRWVPGRSYGGEEAEGGEYREQDGQLVWHPYTAEEGVEGHWEDPEITSEDRYKRDAETDSFVGQALEAQINALKPIVESSRNREISGHLGRARTLEESLRTQLLGQQEDFLNRLDARLNLGLQESGVKAGEARALTGAALAQRGLTRSSVGSRALNEITSQEQEQKGALRSESSRIGSQAQKVIRETTGGIEQRRKELEAKKDIAELRQFNELGFQVDQQKIKDEFQQALMNAEFDANDEAFWWGIAGKLVGTGAQLGTKAL